MPRVAVDRSMSSRVPAGAPAAVRPRDAGVALFMALLVMVLLSAVAGGLLLLASAETRIAGAERARVEAHGVAEVLLEQTLQELLQSSDWSAVLSGSTLAAFRDPSGPPRVAGWGVLDLAAITLSLQRESDDLNRWGPDGPRWRLYAYGPADSLFGGTDRGRAAGSYVAAWVADDPGEGDGDPGADRNDTLQVRADAFGPLRTRQALMVTVRRSGGLLRIASRREPAAP